MSPRKRVRFNYNNDIVTFFIFRKNGDDSDCNAVEYDDDAVPLYRQNATLGLARNSPDADTVSLFKQVASLLSTLEPPKEADYDALTTTHEAIKGDENDNGAVALFRQAATLGMAPGCLKETSNGAAPETMQDAMEEDEVCDYEAVPLYKQNATLGQRKTQNEWCKFSKTFTKKIRPILKSTIERHTLAN